MSEQDKIESMGSYFQQEKFLEARNLAFNIVRRVAGKFQVGMTELDGCQLLKDELIRNSCEELWHPHKVRIGENTTKSFREKSEPNVKLKENDIFFIDMGAVFEGHESDYAETFVLGNNNEYKKIIEKAKQIFDEVKDEWKKKSLTGSEIYTFAEDRATKHGYVLNLKELGHRLGDFPHAIHSKAKLGNINFTPSPERWVLEIHIQHANQPYGAFYEDLLR